MRISFARPLARIVGEQSCTITVHQSVTVEEVIQILSRKFAHTEVFQMSNGKAIVPCVCMVLKNGKYLVKPEDRINDADELELIPPIMGG